MTVKDMSSMKFLDGCLIIINRFLNLLQDIPFRNWFLSCLLSRRLRVDGWPCALGRFGVFLRVIASYCCLQCCLLLWLGGHCWIMGLTVLVEFFGNHYFLDFLILILLILYMYRSCGATRNPINLLLLNPNLLNRLNLWVLDYFIWNLYVSGDINRRISWWCLTKCRRIDP